MVLTPPGDPRIAGPSIAGPSNGGPGNGGPSEHGTGKTQLAAALARALWETRTVDLLVWVTAISRDAIVTAYAQALTDVEMAEQDEDPEADASQFLAWLAETSRPWLVVLDELADPADLAGLWPQGAAGRVLITTRRRDATLRGPDRRIVPVGPFTLREALAYLTARLHDDPGQRTEALDLAKDLSCHPLALAQAAALLTDTGASCREYRLWSADRRRYLASAASGDLPSALEVTWSLSIERANQLPPAGLAEPALVLTALLDPSGIPGAALLSYAACSYITGHDATTADQAEVRDAVNNLHRLGLLTINPTSAARTAAAHAIVKALVLKSLTPDELDLAVHAAADALLESWPQRDAERPLLAQALRDSTAILNQAGSGLLWSPQGHGVLIRAGQSLDAARLRGASIAYWQDMSAASARQLGPGHAQTLLFRDHLAGAEGKAGQSGAAIGMQERTLADRERALGPSHPETLTSYGELAHAYQKVGRLDDAIALFERTLSDREWVLGADSPDTITARGHLAQAYQQAGRLKEAIPLYERILADRERAQDRDHPDTLTARGQLAQAYQHAGLVNEAIPLYERILAERERAQGRDHPDTLTARGHLAYAYRTAGRLKNAIPQYEKTLAGRERVLGAAHPDTMTARSNLANAYYAARRVKDALPQYARTLADRERAQGRDHPDTLTARGNLASVYHAAGRLTDALPLYQQTLADSERVLGRDHPLTQTMRENLAALGQE